LFEKVNKYHFLDKYKSTHDMNS